MLIKTEYSVLKTGRDDVSFIGMNTRSGFRSVKNGIIDEKELKRTYIIKGGPGTGKSTLMRTVSDRFENDKIPVSRFLCSSDPDSLDAVLINNSVLFIDGTAPHVKEMKYPGACSEAICLSNFWSRDKLSAFRDEIVELTDGKTELFSRVYRIIHSINTLYLSAINDVGNCYLRKESEAAANRLTRNITIPVKKASEYLVRSFGMKGAVRLDTLEKHAETIIKLRDYYGTGYIFMEDLFKSLKEKGIGFLYSTEPMMEDKVTDIFVPEKNILFTTEDVENAEKTINTERFIDIIKLRSCRGSVRLSVKCANELFKDAEALMKEIAIKHFRLEELYGAAMNFDAIGEYTKLLIKDVENYI